MKQIRTHVTILALNKGRLGNRLLGFASVLAYCIERGYTLDTLAFGPYQSAYDLPVRSWFGLLFVYGAMGRTWLYKKLRVQYWYNLLIQKIHPSTYIEDTNTVWYLPPSTNATPWQYRKLASVEARAPRTIYMNGWLFRNPVGLEKHAAAIRSYLRPKQCILESVTTFLAPIHSTAAHVIGVHIRQGDYKQLFEQGAYYFDERAVRNMLDGYLAFSGYPAQEVCFVICSDEHVDTAPFAGLQVHIAQGNAVEDLHTLASCDAIIGADSTFGAWASYYGDIPFYVFERGGIPWEWYKDKPRDRYFQNERCTMAHYS